jgi:hypothetical protein
LRRARATGEPSSPRPAIPRAASPSAPASNRKRKVKIVESDRDNETWRFGPFGSPTKGLAAKRSQDKETATLASVKAQLAHVNASISRLMQQRTKLETAVARLERA